MNQYDQVLLKKDVRSFRPVILVLVPLMAVLLDSWLKHVMEMAHLLEIPLLVVIHYALMRREQMRAMTFGCVVGLMQDSLQNTQLGLNGIAKTLAGYFVASVSLRFAVDNPAIRLLIGFFFYLFHEFLKWLMERALLGMGVGFLPLDKLMQGVLNAAVGLLLFVLLDKLKDRP
jgi:rod shape-determining protein MreD